MAARGSSFKEIIGFYYSDIIITDVKNAVIPLSPQFGVTSPKSFKGGF
jgi:hypothetical protein